MMSSELSRKGNQLLGLSMDSAMGRTGNLPKAAHCVDDTESSTVSVTNPSTAAAVKPQTSSINMPGRSTPASIQADSFLAPENYLYLPDVPRITPDNNDEGLRTLAILAKENLDREYWKINSALQKKCEYIKRSLNIEDLNYLKPSNKKGRGANYCRIIEMKQMQRSNLSLALLPASVSPPHIQSSDFSTSVPTYTQMHLPAAEQTPKSFNSGLKGKFLMRCTECQECVHVRSAKCQRCGYNFKARRMESKHKMEESLRLIGKKVAGRNNISRAYRAIEKQMAKMRGAGYETLFIYYKKGLHKATQGILPADCLTAADSKSISNIFHLYRKRKLEAAEVNQLTVEHNDSVTPLTRGSNGIGCASTKQTINQDDVDIMDKGKTTDFEISSSGMQQLEDDSSTPILGKEKPQKFRKI
ncbi:uncharacterized protein [Procambarus clarkii]|uniref:uncharacterized protein n=1 Tax=Procambarus clarkii TaxID=6728 RepID=UPI0037438AAC